MRGALLLLGLLAAGCEWLWPLADPADDALHDAGLPDVPVQIPAVPPQIRQAADACARITGCFPMGGMEKCATLLLGVFDPSSLSACVQSTSDCAAVGRCLNAGDANSACDPAIDGTRCDGTKARKCVEGIWLGMDCANLGMECIRDTTTQLWCGKQGACAAAYCVGQGFLACVNDVMAYTACGEGPCVDSASGDKACAGEGEACTPGTFRCEGNVAVSCRNGRLHRQLCIKCKDADGAFCAPDTQCSTSRCEGKSLVACVRGVPFVEDCTALGFAGCKLEGNEARCTP